MEERMCVEIKVSIDDRERIGVENITEAVKKADLNKVVTQQIIEALQDRLVEDMCGKKYERNKECTRASAKWRTIGTIFGSITLPIRRVRDKRTGKIRKPLKGESGFQREEALSEGYLLGMHRPIYKADVQGLQERGRAIHP